MRAAVLLGLLVTSAAAFTGLVSRCAVPRCATLRAALPRAELSDPESEAEEAEEDWLLADDDAGGDSAVQAMLDAFLADGGSFEETADVTDDEAGIAPDDEVTPARAPTLALTQPQPSPGPEPSPEIWRRRQ